VNARWLVKKATRAACAVGTVAPRRARAIAEPAVVRALTYHRFGDVRGDAFWVSARELDAQMAWLAERGRAVSLDDVQAFVAGTRDLPRDAVLVTIDDGSVSTLRVAAPILARHRIPAVAYVTSSLIGLGDLGHGERFLSWEELSELADSGIAIGSHAHTHRSLGKMPPTEAREEARRSKETIEQKLGRPVTSFAYPFGTHGDFTTDTEQALRDAGYTLAFNSKHGAIRRGMDPISLPRVKIEGGDAEWMFRLAAQGAMDGWRLVDDNLWRLQRVRKELTPD
jgi:peptidoglycan/xylan/chitin deacetylase (PgdA/CDA1 family)